MESTQHPHLRFDFLNWLMMVFQLRTIDVINEAFTDSRCTIQMDHFFIQIRILQYATNQLLEKEILGRDKYTNCHDSLRKYSLQNVKK